MLISEGPACVAGRPAMASREPHTLSRSWFTAVPGIRNSVGESLSFSVLQYRSCSDQGLDGRVPRSPSAVDRKFSPAVQTSRTFGAHRPVYGRNAYPLRKCEGFRVYRPIVKLSRTALYEEEDTVSKCIRASRNVGQESCRDSPRQGFGRGKQLPVGSASGRCNLHLPSACITSGAIAIRNCRGEQALSIDSSLFIEILKSCLMQKDLTATRQVHEYIILSGMQKNPYVATTLLNVYIKCGRLQEAHRVFDDLERTDRNVITWNVMIGAYAKRGCGMEAYRLFHQMQREGFIPNAITYLSILNASASSGALEWVKEVHSHARSAGLESDSRVGNALVHMYAKSGSIDDARLVFDRMEKCDVFTWNIMIGAYAESGCGMEAYRLFLQMTREGFIPDAITYSSILNESASAGALEWVREVHSHARRGGLESDLRVGNALVLMYAKIGSIDDARLIFDKMEKRDVVTWTTMIGGLAQYGCGHEAVELFRNMNAECVKPNEASLLPVLSREGDKMTCCLQPLDDPKGTSTVKLGSKFDFRVWQGTLISLGRTFALSCATACLACWLLGAGQSLAAANDSSSVLMALGERASDLRGSVWPKCLSILAVFKDQGFLLAALLGLSAFFSMAETSIMTLWPWKVRELAEKEGEGGVFGLVSKDVTRFLTTILIGTTVVNIAATALVTDAATSLFGEAGVTAATGLMTVVILLVTEIAPKSIAVHNATKVARFAVRPVAWLSVILYPVGRIVTALSMALLKLLGLKSTGETSVSEEELKLMLRGAELSGAIEEEEQDMIENVLEIKDTFVREVMTPLVDVVAIDAESTLMEFRECWVKHQYSRTPVYERRIDNIVGIAYAMDMLDYIDYDSEQVKVLQRLTVGRIAHRPAYFVPDSMSVWNLLREFRIRKVHMAIVLNEYGGAVGVVTLEDVVEEIVGEIFDENDSKEEIRKKTGYVVQRADGVFDVDANTHIEDLSEALEVKMPEGPYRYETVSGFVCEAFGYIPRTGESIDIILEKAEVEDAPDRRDREADHQKDNKEKIQTYRLEILAGNARKVGAVRFQVSKAQSKEGEVAFSRSIGAFGKVWAKPVNFSGEETCENPSNNDDEFCEAEIIDDCLPDESQHEFSFSKQHLIEEPVDLDSDMMEAPPPSRNGATVFPSGDWTLLSREPTAIAKELIEDGDMRPKAPKGALNQGRVHVEKQAERRLRRRMKQSAEAAVEVDRQRRVDVLRQQVKLEMEALKDERDIQSLSKKTAYANGSAASPDYGNGFVGFAMERTIPTNW